MLAHPCNADDICWQVVPLLQRLGGPRDVAVINYGLHFSDNYEGSLRTLVQHVSHAARTAVVARRCSA